MNVQYEAALALAGINKFPAPWTGSEKVAGVLARGVSENKPLYILVVDEDQNQVNIMRGRLEGLNYGVSEAYSGRQGLNQARAHPPKDLILISDKLRRDFTTEQLIEELRADINTRYTPVAILHNHAEANLVKSRFGADRLLVEREAEGDTLKGMVTKLEEARPQESVPKKNAHELSRRCAEALAGLTPSATLLTLNDAVPACVTALENRKDDIRIPAATFVGHMAGGTVKADAEKRLAEVFLNAGNILPLRKAALTALGAVNREKYTDVYLKAQTEKEHELQEEAAYNFGRAPRESKTILEFLKTKRVEKDKKEK
jgi:CheY-like chemotaxis protein